MTRQGSRNSAVLTPVLVVAAVTIVSLLPFLARPFNIDEPLFVWVARQIHAHPLDFYGFQANWYGTAMNMSDITKNPPLGSYYLALVALLFGWSEAALHAGCLLPAAAASAGTFLLARRLTGHPLHATLLAIVTPVFLMSSATVMCDTLMLALYVWTIFFWMRGIEEHRRTDLLAAALLLTLCALTKYFGITLIPLLLAYTFCRGRERLRYGLFLLIPLVALAAYQSATLHMYGRGLLSDAAGYAGAERQLAPGTLLPNLIAALVFTGGCLLSPLLLAKDLWSRKTIGAAAVFVAVAAPLLAKVPFPRVGDSPGWTYFLQMSLFAAGGIGLLALVLRHVSRDRSPESILLFLWIAGTFVFASVFNWTVNGRTILPMAPAAGILVMRILEARHSAGWRAGKSVAAGIAAGWAVAMTAAHADARLAQNARDAATTITREFAADGKRLWFQGHWGFQYYMEKSAASAYDAKKSVVSPGDRMALSENNTNLFQEVVDKGYRLKILGFPPARPVSTMNFLTGAGYYAHRYGAMPFVAGNVPDENYHLIAFQQAVLPPFAGR